MMGRLLRNQALYGLLLGGVVVSAMPVFAQSNTTSSTADAEEISSVLAFNRICYSRVPDVQSIGDMATRFAWRKLDKDDLEAFDTGEKLDVLNGWDALIGERVYRVGISQGPITDSQLEIFPDFEGGLTTSCTFVLDGFDKPGVVATDMQTLAGKEPVSKDVPEGDLKTTTWAGGIEDVKVFLVSKSGGENGGLLNVTLLTK